MNELDEGVLRKQLLAHLKQLRAAGVEWVRGGSHILPPSGERRNAEGARPALGSSPSPPTSLPHGASGETAPPNHERTTAGGSEQRQEALRLLAREVSTCTRCTELCSTRTQTVFGDGGPGVELCFIGEAPGADEDRAGVPFVGEAGQLLDKIIAGCGLKREAVYICNILKCRPPGNRTPLANEAANCRGYLERQLELVQPKFICTLGGCAATNLLQTTLSVGKLRGRFHDYKGIPVICTYHPAYLLPHRSPEKKQEVWQDMKTLLARMGRTPPPRPRTSHDS